MPGTKSNSDDLAQHPPSTLKVVDVHTHVYTQSYMELLRERKQVPRILPGATPNDPERLVILPNEEEQTSTNAGRPIGEEYYSVKAKLAFMDLHDIDISVISLANPWLDWMHDEEEAESVAHQINEELVGWCTLPETTGRFYAFGVLPTSCVAACVREIQRLSQQKLIKGVIIGTLGAGKGLDDPALDPMWEALQCSGLMTFVHPHYHLPKSVYGEQENGHVLPLAFGFPVETSIAIARLILAGVLDRFPDLKLLLAHSGGVLPFLAGRLDSCVAHDRHVSRRLKHPPSYYLSKLYYDALSYQPASLECTKALLGGSSKKLLFGVDHPFFPPIAEGGALGPAQWESVLTNKTAVMAAFSGEEAAGVMGLNAIRILGLDG